MYTEEQIAEALECCAFETPMSSCEKCPLFDDCADLEKIAAERIRFLKSEIEILKIKSFDEFKRIFEKRCLDCGIYTEQVRKQFEQSLDEMGVFYK